jgi:hypothetical protein
MTKYEQLLAHLEKIPILLAAEHHQRALQEERFALWRSHGQLCGGPPQHEHPSVTLSRAWECLSLDERCQFLCERLTREEYQILHKSFDPTES